MCVLAFLILSWIRYGSRKHAEPFDFAKTPGAEAGRSAACEKNPGLRLSGVL
jgi:hypothetical protein